MIENREDKIKNIIEGIERRSYRDIDDGPGWYFYIRVLDQRSKVKDIKAFIQDRYNKELLYATLACWGMHRLGKSKTKMLPFDDFSNNIDTCENYLTALDNALKNRHSQDSWCNLLKNAYINLRIMRCNTRIVSVSKLLHYLFPDVLIPIDKAHTLKWLYDGDNSEDNHSADKYLEIIMFSFDIMQQNLRWNDYLNDEGNTTVPKLIDNVIWNLASA